MSATNRGTERSLDDLYPTPLDAFEPLIPYLPTDGQVWEPAWGDARLVRRMLELEIDAWGTDLRDEENPVDFLQDKTQRHTILTNPPFSVALQFCAHAVAHATHVFMLLRLNFLASKRRKEWFSNHEPNALFILSDRPCFVLSVKCAKKTDKKCDFAVLILPEEERPKRCPKCGGAVKISSSDSCEYAWYYWGPKWQGLIHL